MMSRRQCNRSVLVLREVSGIQTDVGMACYGPRCRCCVASRRKATAGMCCVSETKDLPLRQQEGKPQSVFDYFYEQLYSDKTRSCSSNQCKSTVCCCNAETKPFSNGSSGLHIVGVSQSPSGSTRKERKKPGFVSKLSSNLPVSRHTFDSFLNLDDSVDTKTATGNKSSEIKHQDKVLSDLGVPLGCFEIYLAQGTRLLTEGNEERHDFLKKAFGLGGYVGDCLLDRGKNLKAGKQKYFVQKKHTHDCTSSESSNESGKTSRKYSKHSRPHSRRLERRKRRQRKCRKRLPPSRSGSRSSSYHSHRRSTRSSSRWTYSGSRSFSDSSESCSTSRSPDRRINNASRSSRSPDRCINSARRISRLPDHRINSASRNSRSPDRRINSSSRNSRSSDRRINNPYRSRRLPDRCINSTSRNSRSSDRRITSASRNSRSPDRHINSSSSNSRSRDRRINSASRSRSFSTAPERRKKGRSVRSPSIRRRHGSPCHLDKRRITSARKRPVPYTRPEPPRSSSSSSSSSSDSSSSWQTRSYSSQSCIRSLSRSTSPDKCQGQQNHHLQSAQSYPHYHQHQTENVASSVTTSASSFSQKVSIFSKASII